MKDLDIKSLIIGILAASVVWIAVYIIIGGAVGRYVLAGGSQLMDTRNGTIYKRSNWFADQVKVRSTYVSNGVEVVQFHYEGGVEMVGWAEVFPSVGEEATKE